MPLFAAPQRVFLQKSAPLVWFQRVMAQPPAQGPLAGAARPWDLNPVFFPPGEPVDVQNLPEGHRTQAARAESTVAMFGREIARAEEEDSDQSMGDDREAFRDIPLVPDVTPAFYNEDLPRTEEDAREREEWWNRRARDHFERTGEELHTPLPAADGETQDR